jgi:hypothetical protein
VAKETTSSKVSFSQSKNNNPTHIFCIVTRTEQYVFFPLQVKKDDLKIITNVRLFFELLAWIRA